MTTVVTPATLRRLTTVTNVRADLGIALEAASDAQVNRLIDQATSAIETYCRRTFAIQTYREWRRWTFGLNDVFLDQAPLVAVVNISEGNSVLSQADYLVENGMIYRAYQGERVAWTGAVLVIDYRAGYALPGTTAGAGEAPLPEAVEIACIAEIAAQRSRRSRDPMLRSESEDGVGSSSWQIEAGSGPLCHPDSAGLLDAFRLYL